MPTLEYATYLSGLLVYEIVGNDIAYPRASTDATSLTPKLKFENSEDKNQVSSKRFVLQFVHAASCHAYLGQDSAWHSTLQI